MNKTTSLIWVNVVLVLAMWIMSFWIYYNLPDSFPSHFNLIGEPDGWHAKEPLSFFLLPSILTIIIVLILMLLRYPQFYNFPLKNEVREWPEEAKTLVYLYLKQGILIIGMLLCLMFIYIQYIIGETAKSNHNDEVNMWIMIAITAVWLLIMIMFITRVNKVVKRTRKKLERSGSESNTGS